VEALPDGALRVTGEMTIRGVSREVTVPVRLLPLDPADEDGTAIGFETRFQLDRTDYGVNGTRWSAGRLMLSHEVDIHLRILARRR
jgi:polyisoprenoid-binding protein YceI